MCGHGTPLGRRRLCDALGRQQAPAGAKAGDQSTSELQASEVGAEVVLQIVLQLVQLLLMLLFQAPVRLQQLSVLLCRRLCSSGVGFGKKAFRTGQEAVSNRHC